MLAAPRAGSPPRPRLSWKLLALAGLVAVGVAAYLKLATAKFRWWREATFAGQVVAKEARARDTGESAPADVALSEPRGYCFFLLVRDEQGVAAHQVVSSAFRQVQIGDHVEKAAGTYRIRRVAARDDRPAGPET